MSTQTVEFRAATGQTITAKLFSFGSDTEVASVSATEATNRKGTYTAAFTSVAAGEYQLIAFNSTPVPVASWWVTLEAATATYEVYDKANKFAIADQVYDEAMSEHITNGTYGSHLVRSANQNQNTVSITGSQHIAADVHAFQADVIDAAAIAASAVTEIQSGLATSAGVTSAFTEIKGTGWSSTTDTLEKIADSAGGGGVTVAPLQATAPNRVAGTEIVTYINDTSLIGPIVVTDGDGSAVDLSGYTLKVCVELKSTGTINANITPTVSGAGNNQITFTPTSDCVSSTLPRKWSLRSTSDGQVFAFGDFTVEATARLS